MCEQAGTGMRMMREAWQALGHPAPVYKNERAWKAFELFIPELDKEVDMASDLMKAMFGETPPAPDKHPTSIRQVASEVAGEVTDQDTRRVPGKYPTSTRQVTPQESSVLKAAVNPSSRSALQQASALRNREHFMDSVLKPLLTSGLLEMTIPDKPRSSKQRYRLTEKGSHLLAGIRGVSK